MTLRPFWHPLSTLLLEAPPCFATRTVLRMVLRSGPAELRYAGDRMWPALRHGATFMARPMTDSPLAPGSAVVACPGGIPDLWRVDRAEGDALHLVADADPAQQVAAGRDDILALASVTQRRFSRGAARRNRIWLDLREALSARPDPASDQGATVRDKYEAQAPFYVSKAGAGMEQALLERVRERVRGGGRLIVVGSGVGRECFDLARAGFRVIGIDFAPAMIAHAREEAARYGLDVEFRLGDVRDGAFDLGRADAVLFTYDVYSFIPTRSERAQVLERLVALLEPQGCIFLSARRVQSAYERVVLTLQRTRGLRGEWGDSHTRWIDAAGTLRRSFVRLFTARALNGEIRAAGLRLVNWQGGHGLLQRDDVPPLL